MRNNNRNNHSSSNHNNNNNRRGQNPMTRVFESNGPDIKIRGTASHVAEKYVQLARDARTSGDPVAAENYYQHAEHYFRLIAAAQEQFRQNQPVPRDGEAVSNNNNMGDDNGEDESENFSHFGAEPGFAPQPFVPQPPRENNYQQPRENNYQPREQQHQPREHRPQPSYQPQPQPAVQPSDAAVGGLPSFITGPQPVAGAPFEGNPQANGERDRFPRRRRRPHGPRPEGAAPAPVPAGDDV